MLNFCPRTPSNRLDKRWSNFLSNSTVSVTSIDSKDEAYNDEDPYNGSPIHRVVSTPMLGENMMRNFVNRDPYEIYECVKLLGRGSMLIW